MARADNSTFSGLGTGHSIGPTITAAENSNFDFINNPGDEVHDGHCHERQAGAPAHGFGGVVFPV